MSQVLSRRVMLKGLGTAMALPWLEAMMPRVAWAASSTAGLANGPRRMAFIYVPNGVNTKFWFPETAGAGFEMTRALTPIERHRDKMTVLGNLLCDKANANGDGPGDHARAMSAYLTGSQPRKTEGANIHVGMSVDQAAAAKIGHLTRFPSLELGIEEGRQFGRCDSGYSCAYNHNLSWKSATTPAVKECDPQLVFDRLFGNGDPRETEEQKAKREARRKSILDFVGEDARRLDRQLGAADRRKVDEYMSSIREIEQRLSRLDEGKIEAPAGAERPPLITRGRGMQDDRGVGQNYPDHVKLMCDMMALAFQTDQTRVATLPFANEASNQEYPWCDADVPHHGTSHHAGDEKKLEYLARINAYHISLFGHLLDKLDSIQEGNGTVLDNSMIVYGSGNSDGSRHNHDNIPVLLLGKGGGSIQSGRYIKYASNTPCNNLWLALLDRMGAPYKTLGDSTGVLEGLS